MTAVEGMQITAGETLKPIGLLVIQPTAFCNINCSYCYLPGRALTKRMTTDTLRAAAEFLRNVPRVSDPLSVVWHAGEPLAVPISFYEDAFSIFASASVPIRQHFQTNGTLLDDRWCRLIKKWNVGIGVSIDGPRHIHDSNRVDHSGRGTFDRVMRGIDKLREHQIPFTVISVITQQSLGSAEELVGFFQSLGAVSVGFNIEESEGSHLSSSLMGDDLASRVRDFFTQFMHAQSGTPPLRIRELMDMRRHLVAPPDSVVTRATNRAGQIINIDIEGNITTFSPELLGQSHPVYGDFNWGNVHRNSWADIQRHPGFQRALADISAGVENCRKSCEYFPVCGGGNPSNKLAELGTFTGTETQNCRLHVKAIADVVMEHLEEELHVPAADFAEVHQL